MKYAMPGVLTFLCLATAATAQIGPQDAIKKVLEEVRDEMREIDRLLLESSRGEAVEGLQRNIERLEELMNETRTSQDRVLHGIDRLVEELHKMMQQSQGGGSPQDRDQQSGEPNDRPQDGREPQGGQQPGTRRELPTPDMVRQRREGQGEEQQQQQGEEPRPEPEGQVADGDRDPEEAGRNRNDGSARQDGEERVERDPSADEWGQLPPYVQFLQTRGGVPDVPEKYRRVLEAYQKQAHSKKR